MFGPKKNYGKKKIVKKNGFFIFDFTIENMKENKI